MDSLSEVHEHGSVAKRLKLDTGVLKNGELCGGETPQFFSTSTSTPSYGLEGMSTDYDSGCGTSILGTTPIPSLQTSPNTDSQDTFSDSSQTPVYIGSMNISQESTDNTEDNVSTISRLSDLSGLSELSGQDWKPMAGSMIWLRAL